MSTQESAGGAGYATPGAGRLEEKGRELGRRADAIGARVQTGLRDGAHEVGAAKDRIKTRAQDGRVRVEREMQEHPMRVLAWAFGIGAVAGLLLGRRSRR